jgi:hypothetical protein
MPTNLNNPKAISELGESIYVRLYKAEYEKNHRGKYVAININDESATVGDTASSVLREAKKRHPQGLFHLIRVGRSGAFEVGIAYRHVGTSRIP